MNPSILRSVATLACLLVSPAFLHADVLEVGAGQPFASIQAAVDAASDGDHVLVHTGSYGAFTVQGLELSVVADAGETVDVTGRVTVRDLAAGQVVVLAGLAVSVPTGPAVDLLDIAGSVRVHGSTLSVASGSQPVIRMTQCDDVVLVSCSAGALGPDLFGAGKPGLHAVRSKVALYDSSITGGTGGPGGDPDPIFGGGSGDPGADGPPVDVQAGFAAVLPGQPRHLDLPSPSRELQMIVATLHGQPGDLAAVFWRFDTAHVFGNATHGPLLVSLGPPAHLLFLGSIPTSGSLPLGFAFPELGPGLEAVTVLIQPLFVEAGSEFFLGSPVSEVVLDTAFQKSCGGLT